MHFKILNEKLIAFIVIMLLTSLLGVLFIQMPDWDWYNYRYYNGWAFLNGRMDIDIMPVLHRTYFNPVLDVISYLEISKLNNYPTLFLILHSMKYGVFLFLSYLLFTTFIKMTDGKKNIAVIAATLMTAYSPILVFVNSSSNDIQVSILVLLSFYLMFKNMYKENCLSRNLMIIFAGFVIGMAVGFKYSTGTFVLSQVICMLVFRKSIPNYIKQLMLYLVSVSAGFLISNGWWMYMLYEHFANPLYPYFNNIFHPGENNMGNVLSGDFSHLRPKNIYEFFVYPLKNQLKGCVGIESSWFDIKVQAAFISTIVLIFMAKFKNLEDKVKNFIDLKNLYLILLYTTSAYYINLILFAQYRYIIVLIPFIVIISYACLFAISNTSIFSKYFFYMQYLFMLVCLIFIYKYHSSELVHLLSYFVLYLVLFYCIKWKSEQQKIFYVLICLYFLLFISTCSYLEKKIQPCLCRSVLKVQDLNIPDNSTVLITLGSSYIAPFQNPNVKYVGISKPVKRNIIEKDRFDNMYFSSNVLDEEIEKDFRDSEKVFLLYGVKALSLLEYRKFVNYYLRKNNMPIMKLKNCNYKDSWYFENSILYFVCEIK